MPKPYQRQLFAQARAKETPRGANERVDVKLWLVDDSREKSVLFSMGREGADRPQIVCIARSLMGEHVSKFRHPDAAVWRWEFTLPRWKADELGLEYS